MAFEGVRPVLHVPFADEPGQGIVDAELVALVERLIAAGVDGLVVLGLASEAWALTERERDHVVETVADACRGRLPLTVGLEGATAVAVERARRAVGRGAASLMVLPPSGAEGETRIVRHFVTLADAAGVPLLIQDSPQVSGVNLDVRTIAAIGRAHPLARSLKVEVPGAGPKATAAHEEGIEIVAGWGGLGYLEQIERGATGCMPGCDLAAALVAIHRAAWAGDLEGARATYRHILPLLAFETASLALLLLGAKRHLQREGIFTSGSLRAPARELDAVEAVTLDALLDELALSGVPGFGSGRPVPGTASAGQA